MDVVWLVLGVILMLVGLAGCILPFLPGPPLCYMALLIQDVKDRLLKANHNHKTISSSTPMMSMIVC